MNCQEFAAAWIAMNDAGGLGVDLAGYWDEHAPNGMKLALKLYEEQSRKRFAAQGMSDNAIDIGLSVALHNLRWDLSMIALGGAEFVWSE